MDDSIAFPGTRRESTSKVPTQTESQRHGTAEGHTEGEREQFTLGTPESAAAVG